MEIKSKVWLMNEGRMVFGKGRRELLEAILAAGSISAAARGLGLSYRHAWSMINSSEKRLRRKLVERVRGGAGGGGARITAYAARLLEKYRSIEREFERLAGEKTRELEKSGD